MARPKYAASLQLRRVIPAGRLPRLPGGATSDCSAPGASPSHECFGIPYLPTPGSSSENRHVGARTVFSQRRAKSPSRQRKKPLQR